MAGKYINRTISVLYRYNQRFINKKLTEYNLSIELGQIPSLMQIYRHPGITQDGISSNACIDKGTTAHAVKQLEAAGLIFRQTDEKDRRINHIYATPEGLKVKEKVFQIVKELHEVLYQGFSDSEILQAISLLERMQNNIENYEYE